MSQNPAMWLPLGFQDWLPPLQAVTLALLTFIQEDVPTVGAALLTSNGTLGWKAGFFGCFFGIWIGDLLLYFLARGIGRPLLEKRWARRFFNAAAVQRSEKWFAEKGTWLLITSRFVPGTRLPTYLAAGFLRVPFTKFLTVTGVVVALWTVAIFVLAHFFGAVLLQWLEHWKHGGWAILIAMVILVLAIRIITKVFQRNFLQRLHGAIGRWTHWEFWPAWLFYSPIIPYYGWLALRYRSWTLPTAANPGIVTGGLVSESKIETLQALTENSPEFTAEAFLVTGQSVAERTEELNRLRALHQIDYPYILKPDVGQRGLGVKLIRNAPQAVECLQNNSSPHIIQRYAPGPFEIGVFYYRFPNEARGHIFAITEKIFPNLMGDGKHTIEELIWRDPRGRFMAGKYLERLGSRSAEVLPAGQELKLVESGNHAQGCIFRDGMRLCSPELESQIDDISKKVPGFFFGRYDIRYAAPEDLKNAQQFKIIELNGASSEATSIYDSRNSLWSAYRTLFKQWDLVFAIGSANRHLGCEPMNLGILLKRWREAYVQMSALPLGD